MMNSHSKKKHRRLVLRREQVRQLDAGHLAQLRGGLGEQGFSAGACTESCAGCQHTTGVNTDDC
jgi:hypothetical protein